MESTKYGKQREMRWTPIRAKAQDTRANPNSLETHLVRKRWDIGLLRALSPRLMMMMMMMMMTNASVAVTVILLRPVLVHLKHYSFVPDISIAPMQVHCMLLRYVGCLIGRDPQI